MPRMVVILLNNERSRPQSRKKFSEDMRIQRWRFCDINKKNRDVSAIPLLLQKIAWPHIDVLRMRLSLGEEDIQVGLSLLDGPKVFANCIYHVLVHRFEEIVGDDDLAPMPARGGASSQG